MTVAAAPFPPPGQDRDRHHARHHARHHDRHRFTRWGVSLAVILALHAGLALYVASHRIPIEPSAAPPDAVMIDLAPITPAPPPPIPEPVQPTPPPPPEPQVVQPEPPPPEPIPETPPPPPEPPPPPKAVILPKPPPPHPKPPPKPRPVVERPPPPVPAPPMPAPAPPPVAAAPAQPSPAAAAAAAAARTNWQGQLVAWLARYKRYPHAAEEARQEGTPMVQFSLDRSGHLLSSRLARSSGNNLLDEEALAMLQRAQPFPAPPAEMPGQRFDLSVPIAFTVRR